MLISGNRAALGSAEQIDRIQNALATPVFQSDPLSTPLILHFKSGTLADLD
jgi:hypothetical protein